MEIKASVLRWLAEIINPHVASRFAGIRGIHVFDGKTLEVTDAYVLVRVPVKPKDDEKPMLDIVFEKPWALPPPVYDGKKPNVNIKTCKVGAIVTGKGERKIRLCALKNDFPKTHEVTDMPNAGIVTTLAPEKIMKAMAVFVAAGEKAVRIRIENRIKQVLFEGTETGIVAAIMPMKDPSEGK